MRKKRDTNIQVKAQSHNTQSIIKDIHNPLKTQYELFKMLKLNIYFYNTEQIVDTLIENNMLFVISSLLSDKLSGKLFQKYLSTKFDHIVQAIYYDKREISKLLLQNGAIVPKEWSDVGYLIIEKGWVDVFLVLINTNHLNLTFNWIENIKKKPQILEQVIHMRDESESLQIVKLFSDHNYIFSSDDVLTAVECSKFELAKLVMSKIILLPHEICAFAASLRSNSQGKEFILSYTDSKKPTLFDHYAFQSTGEISDLTQSISESNQEQSDNNTEFSESQILCAQPSPSVKKHIFPADEGLWSQEDEFINFDGGASESPFVEGTNIGSFFHDSALQSKEEDYIKLPTQLMGAHAE
jgi:hypothetical protein